MSASVTTYQRRFNPSPVEALIADIESEIMNDFGQIPDDEPCTNQVEVIDGKSPHMTNGEALYATMAKGALGCILSGKPIKLQVGGFSVILTASKQNVAFMMDRFDENALNEFLAEHGLDSLKKFKTKYQALPRSVS